MKGLLLVAHGSRNESARAAIADLTRDVAELLGQQFDVVLCAFLEAALPVSTVQAKLEECVAGGVTEVWILPHFLATGRHVEADLPGIVADFRAARPGLTVTVLPHIGAASGMPALIAEHVVGGLRAG